MLAARAAPVLPMAEDAPMDRPPMVVPMRAVMPVAEAAAPVAPLEWGAAAALAPRVPVDAEAAVVAAVAEPRRVTARPMRVTDHVMAEATR